MATQYWLLKTDIEAYTIDDLERDGSTAWDGIRNYQARNYMRDTMKTGDVALVYHSNADPSAITGLATIGATGFPDETAFDPADSHYDPKATRENPIWCAVELRFKSKLKQPIPLDVLRKTKGLEGMVLLQKGSRLSVSPVTPAEFTIIKTLIKA